MLSGDPSSVHQDAIPVRDEGDPNRRRAAGYRVARYRLALVRDGTVPTGWDRHVRASGDVAALLQSEARDLDREVFWTVLLDGRNKVIGLNVVSVGSLTAALVHPREVFKAAILANAAAIIVAHCHPSGDPSPSAEDLALTKRLCDAGDLLGIRVLDHLVLGQGGAYRSLADEGQLGASR